MRFVPSFIVLIAVAYVGVIGEEAGEEPRTQQGTYGSPGVVDGRQLVSAGYASPPNNQFQDIIQLLLRVEMIKLIRDILVRTTTTTTESTMTTTVIPDDFQDWKEYKGCRYQTAMTPNFFLEAMEDCQDKGAVLAHKNVRTTLDRQALFRDHLGLTGTVWLPLRDTDGDPSVIELQWIEFFDLMNSVYSDYVPDSDTTKIGDGEDAGGATTIGSSYSTIQFPMSLSTAFYVCEYCPP